MSHAIVALYYCIEAYDRTQESTMKIYFAGAIRGGGNDAAFYKKIIEILRSHGTVVGGEHADDEIASAPDKENVDDKAIYERDGKRLNDADVLVAEVTTPSLGVGYEIGVSHEQNKKIIVLFRQESPDKKLSAMINGCPDIIKVNYQTIDDIKSALSEHL